MEFMALGHRGAMAYAPENTMKSFDLALNMGANGLETDVRQTKDGVLVLFHDEDMRRYGGRERIVDLEFQQLLSWDLGGGESIVTLKDFLEKFGAMDLFLEIELKQRHIHMQVLELIKQYVKNLKKVAVTSFDFEILQDVRELDSGITLAWLTYDLTEAELARLSPVGAANIYPNAENITRDKVENAKVNGYIVRAWGVKDERDMNHCLDCGVDGMTINFPDKLIKALSANKN